MKDIAIPPIIQSAFQFENGKRIIIYTSESTIKSFECDDLWRPFKAPFAESPLEWSKKSPTEYHLYLRNKLHSPKEFVSEHSTILTN